MKEGSGSGSSKPKNIRIQIRIRNTDFVLAFFCSARLEMDRTEHDVEIGLVGYR